MKHLTYILFFLCSIIHSQEKEIIILDITTKKPIPEVHLFYKALNLGTITNADGKANILLKPSELACLHLNYNDKLITKENLISLDTIWLTPKVIALDEVVIHKVNLEKKLQYVLDNYFDLYIDYPTEKECSFKETYLLDNNYYRLFLADMKWWSKSSINYPKKKLNKFIKLRLGKISYSKKKQLNLKNEKTEQISIVPNTFIPFLYLDHLLKLLIANIENTEHTIDMENSNTISITYQTNWNTKENKVSSRHIGKITFDKKTNAIIQLINNFEFKNSFKKQLTPASKKEFIFESKNNIIKYDFLKNNQKKWTLKHLYLKFNGSVTSDHIKHSVQLSNSISVLKETKVKRVKNKGSIDLNKNIYENLPSETLTNSNTILLSEKEKKFIFGNSKKTD